MTASVTEQSHPQPWHRPGAPTPLPALSKITRALSHPVARALAALALVVALGFVFNAGGAFSQWSTHRDMLRQVSVYGILAAGMTLVVITGGIDLAVGSVLGLGSVTFALTSLQLGWPVYQAISATLAVGLAAGLLSGALVAKARLQPFISTLAVMVLGRGLAKWMTGGQKISRATQLADGSYGYVDLPASFAWLDQKVAGDNIAVVTLIFAAIAAASWLLLARMRYGRYFYAVGGNEEASRLSGVPVTRVKMLAYALSGLIAAVAGICQAAQEQQGDPEAGGGYELTAIAIVVIGGTRLTGGRGSMAFTLLGALTIGYLEKILSINAVGEPLRLMLTGAIIVAAVLLQKQTSRSV